MKSNNLIRPAKGHATAGSVLIAALALLTGLAVIGGVLLTNVAGKYRAAHQAMLWQESLNAAEMGVDVVVGRLRDAASAGAFRSGGTVPNVSTLNGTYTLPSTDLGMHRAGFSAVVTVQNITVSGASAPFYKITATGRAQTDAARASKTTAADAGSGLGRVLRQLTNVDSGSSNTLLAQRQIEVVAAPSMTGSIGSLTTDGNGAAGIIGDLYVRMNNHNVLTDSYNSTYGSYNATLANGTKNWAENGGVATNGQLVEAGSAHIHGDVFTNNGTATGATNVSGDIYDDFYRELPPVIAPTWAVADYTTPTIRKNTTLDATGTSTSPTRYVVDSLDISGNGMLTFTTPSSGEVYVELYVRGDVKISGQGELKVPVGVNLKMYVGGNADITGKGMVNENSRPKNMLLYGINPAGGPGTKEFKLAGNGNFTGFVYAPDHAAKLAGSGNSGDFFGAIVAESIFMNGTTSIHYDESLASIIPGEVDETADTRDVLAYVKASWLELWDFPSFVKTSTGGKYRIN